MRPTHLDQAETEPFPRGGLRRGLSIPSVTVVDSAGRIIEEEQRRVFRYNAQAGFGADVIFGCGTTGEWNRIANHERQRLIEIEVDEVSKINRELGTKGKQPIEAWAGVTAESRAQTLSNLECALQAGAHAAVIAPLSISDLTEVVSFFQRDISDLFDKCGRWVPVFLYDNADIAVDPRVPHIRTRVVKKLSRLHFVSGVKVSAPRRVLGHYMKGASHFKRKGEFGIYIGDAMQMFEVFRMEGGLRGLAREYLNRYLLHNELPMGVVSGPANVLPREWQRAWRACVAADSELMMIYKRAFREFEVACLFGQQLKTLACIKWALKLDGVIESDSVAEGTPTLTVAEREIFAERYRRVREMLATNTKGFSEE